MMSSSSRSSVGRLAGGLLIFVAGIAVGRWIASTAMPNNGPAESEHGAPTTTGTVMPSPPTAPTGIAPATSADRAAATTLADAAATAPDLISVLEITQTGPRRRALRKTFEALGQADPFDAMARADALGSVSEQHLAINAVITGAGQSDPAAALSLALERRGSLRAELIRSAIQSMTLDDPAQALAACDAIPDGATVCRPAVYQQWAAIRPEEAMADALGDGAVDYQSMAHRAFSTWSHQDPKAALNWLQQGPALGLSDGQQVMLANLLIQEDPSAYDTISQGMPPAMRQTLLQTRINALVDTDINAALYEIEQLAGTPAYAMSVAMASQKWARSDPAAAAQWLLRQPSGPYVDNAVEGVLGMWSERDFAAAERFASALPDEQRAALMPSLAKGLISKDPAAAVRWLADRPGGMDNMSNVLQATSAWARKDSDAVMRFLTRRSDEPWAATATAFTMRTLAMSDLPAARSWLQRLEGTPMHAGAVESVASTGAQFDLDGTLAWADRQRGETRDRAITAMAGTSERRNDRLLDMIQTIGDQSQLHQAITRYAMRFRNSDPDYARDVVGRSALDDEQQRQVLQTIGLD